jgi:O-antigen ligase
MLLLVALQVPSLAARLDPRGNTGILRLSLWQASLNMFLDYPIFGVGLDNFLYEYRGAYMFDTAWREPNLSHPHNLILDFATRLGSMGLMAGATLFIAFWQVARQLPARLNTAWRPVGVGILGALAYSLAHGLVDQSFFLVDLAGSTMLLLGMSIKLEQEAVRLDSDNIDK